MAKRFVLCSSFGAIGFFGYNWLNIDRVQPLLKNQSISINNKNGQTNKSKMYPRDLQKSKRPKVGLGCLILRKNKDNDLEFLVGIRKGSHGEGLYALPGGHLEYGETWQQCAFGETLEETALNIPPSQWRFAFVNNSIAPAKNTNNDNLHYIDIIMTTMYDGNQEPINAEPHKCEGWKWKKWNDHGLDINKTFCGLKAILTSKHFDPRADYAKYVSFDEWAN